MMLNYRVCAVVVIDVDFETKITFINEKSSTTNEVIQ